MDPKQMKKIIDEIINIGNAAKKKEGFKEDLAEANPAALPRDTNLLKKQFAHRIPPSFFKLLSLYDGIKNFEWLDVSILSSKERIKNPHLEKDWEVEKWASVDFKKGQLFIFGQSDSDSHLLAFNLGEPDSQGEYEVVHFDARGILGSYKNLEVYLLDRLKWFRKELK